MKRYFWNLLIAVDQGCNVLFGPALNALLRPKARFGDPDESLSSVFGKGVRNGDCKLCRRICRLLNRIDPGHCDNSIEIDEG